MTQTADDLRGALEALRRFGWGRGSFQDMMSHRVCLVGAVCAHIAEQRFVLAPSQLGIRGEMRLRDALPFIQDVLHEQYPDAHVAFPRIGINSVVFGNYRKAETVVDFNDHILATQAEAEAVLEKAALLAEAEIT